MTDIVKRLREPCFDRKCSACRAEAADDIERLRSEIKSLQDEADVAAQTNRELQAEAKSWEQQSDMHATDAARYLAERDALLPDAERYRWLRQVDRCEAWENLLMLRPITRTEDVDAAIDAVRSAK